MNENEYIIQFRKVKGWSIADMASALGVTSMSIYNWEKGKSIPSATIMLLASWAERDKLNLPAYDEIVFKEKEDKDEG